MLARSYQNSYYVRWNSYYVLRQKFVLRQIRTTSPPKMPPLAAPSDGTSRVESRYNLSLVRGRGKTQKFVLRTTSKIRTTSNSYYVKKNSYYVNLEFRIP